MCYRHTTFNLNIANAMQMHADAKHGQLNGFIMGGT